MSLGDDPIVLTGWGLASAAGSGTLALIDAVAEGTSCLSVPPAEVLGDLPPTRAGLIPDEALSDARRSGQRALLALVDAGEQALASAGLDPLLGRVGLALGTTLAAVERSLERVRSGAAQSDELVPHALTIELRDRLQLRGPTATFSSTCVSALYAMEQAILDLALGRADAVLCAGTDVLGRFVHSGFARLGVLGSALDSDALILGEGACCIVLERESRARERGATIGGVIAGRAMRSDSTNLTAPDETGVGMTAAARAALDEAGCTPRDVAWVTLSAGAAPVYRRMYECVLDDLFGSDRARVRALTWEESVGHVLAASGVLGAAYACLPFGEHGERLGFTSGADARDFEGRCALVLTVGFGGQNGATVVFPREGLATA